MKRISKRFALVAYAVLAITIITFVSMFRGMESVAVIGAAALAGLIAYYTKKESDKPSK